MIYTPEMMRTLARQHDEDSDTRAALMQAADDIARYETALRKIYDMHSDDMGDYVAMFPAAAIASEAINAKGE